MVVSRLRAALAGGLAAMCLVATAMAAEVGISVSNARLEPAPDETGEARIFLTITNATQAPDRLLGADLGADTKVAIAAAAPTAGGAEANAGTTPAPAPASIEIPAGSSVELDLSSAHLEASGFEPATDAASEITLTLRFEQAGEIKVTALVTQAATTASATPTSTTAATPSAPARKKVARARRAEKIEAPARRKKRANRGSH